MKTLLLLLPLFFLSPLLTSSFACNACDSEVGAAAQPSSDTPRGAPERSAKKEPAPVSPARPAEPKRDHPARPGYLFMLITLPVFFLAPQ